MPELSQRLGAERQRRGVAHLHVKSKTEHFCMQELWVGESDDALRSTQAHARAKAEFSSLHGTDKSSDSVDISTRESHHFCAILRH